MKFIAFFRALSTIKERVIFDVALACTLSSENSISLISLGLMSTPLMSLTSNLRLLASYEVSRKSPLFPEYGWFLTPEIVTSTLDEWSMLWLVRLTVIFLAKSYPNPRAD